MQKLTTNSVKETQIAAKQLVEQIIKIGKKDEAIVIGLIGDLGGGKTTFLQGFAQGLGIKEKILSPTFVLQKRFKVKKPFKNFYHIDCYRIRKPEEILELDFKKTIENPENIIAIEWPQKIKKFLPKNILILRFIQKGKNSREIIIEGGFFDDLKMI